MDQQPDKLFRDKLERYDPAVPPQLWNRVAANVQPKRRAVSWLSAAAVALIGSAAIFVFPLTKESTPVASTVIQPPPQEQSPSSNKSNAAETQSQQTIAIEESATPAPPMQVKGKQESSAKNGAPANKKTPHTIENNTLPVIAIPEPQPIAIAEENSILPSATEESANEPSSARKTVTIVFSAKEVNQKYLSKTSGHQATSNQEEASTLKNMLDKAYDLTHNQDPLGELRQKKNEILAMNFRKDKPRTQND